VAIAASFGCGCGLRLRLRLPVPLERAGVIQDLAERQNYVENCHPNTILNFCFAESASRTSQPDQGLL